MAAQRKRVATKASKKAAGQPSKLKAFTWKISGHGPWYTATLRWIAFLSVVGILFGALTFFVLYQAIKIPDANAAFETQTTKVYYSDGKHVIGSFATQDRENIPLSDMPASMQAAAIAAEDRTFYSNRGIDFKGIIRAARDNASSGQITGGGSTITQQYVKILYLNQERSYTRKVKEAILSIKIHNQLTKKKILEGYLNTIYFGNGSYGLEVAAQTYFDKPAKELEYEESALLATIINSPSFYDPYTEGAEERITPRFHYVLDGMVKSGAITAEQRVEWQDKLPKVAKKRTINRFSGSKGYLLQLVKDQMQYKLQFSPEQIDGGGLRIITTFDYKKQKEAIKAIKALRPPQKELNQSLVSVQPGTGAVRAMYAGRDYLKNTNNWATNKTQPGSTFKVFAVIAALQDGYSLKTKLNGNSPITVGKNKIENQGDSGGASFGPVPLSKATEKSINTAFVDLTEQMSEGGDISTGAEKVLEAAKQAGIPAKVADKIGPVAVTSLGYAPVAPVDMANAYATLAADGKRADWFVIEKVTGPGVSPYKHKVKTEQTIEEDVVADTISSLQLVVKSGSGKNGRTICPTAGKTGTATAGADNDQHVSSSWFAGFTPKLATTVMYNRGKFGNGQLDGYMTPAFFGGTIPAQTFGLYMNAVLDGSNCGSFPRAANIKSTKGTTYKKPAPKCDSDEMLNDAKTKCIQKPPPKCTPPKVLNDAKTACITPATPDPETCDPPNTVLNPNNNQCVDPQQNSVFCENYGGGDWNGLDNPPCTFPPPEGGGGVWSAIPLILAGLWLRRRWDDETEPVLVVPRP